jgi:hypothetical protein
MISFGHVVRLNKTIINVDGTAGTAGTLTVATTSGLGVGARYQILSEDGYCDNIVIVNLSDSSTIIVNKLARNYGTGSKIGQPASTFGLTNGVSTPLGYWYPVSAWGDVGTAGTSTISHGLMPLTSPGLYNYLFFNEQKYLLTPTTVSYLSTTFPSGYIMGHLGNYHLFGYLAADSDVMVANNDGSFSSTGTGLLGTASSAGTASLIDSSKAWGTNELIGKFCVITGGSGTAAGGVKKITGNDATSFIADSNWGIMPVSGAIYIVADDVRRGFQNQLYNAVYVLITSTMPPA